MKKLTQEQMLLNQIEFLQNKQDAELRELKYHVHNSVKLLNPFTSFFSSDAATTTDTQTSLTEGVVNMVSQYLFRHSFLSYFQEPTKEFLRNLLQRFL